MQLYRPKHATLEVVKFEYTGECLLKLSNWMGDYMATSGKERHIAAVGWLQIRSPVGTDGKRTIVDTAIEGDYILKGTTGEFFRVSALVFEATYELA